MPRATLPPLRRLAPALLLVLATATAGAVAADSIPGPPLEGVAPLGAYCPPRGDGALGAVGFAGAVAAVALVARRRGGDA